MSKLNIIKEDYEKELQKLNEMKLRGASERDIFIQSCLVEYLHQELIKEGDKRK